MVRHFYIARSIQAPYFTPDGADDVPLSTYLNDVYHVYNRTEISESFKKVASLRFSHVCTSSFRNSKHYQIIEVEIVDLRACRILKLKDPSAFESIDRMRKEYDDMLIHTDIGWHCVLFRDEQGNVNPR